MNTPVLPQDLDLERVILGAVLIREDREQFEKIRRELDGILTGPFHREILNALSALVDRGDEINPMLLWKELEARGSTFKDIPVRIAELTDGVPHLSNLKTEIRKLKEIATRREIIKCSDAWLREAEAKDVDLAALVEAITKRAADFGYKSSVPSAPLSISWGQACDMEFPPRENILHGIERGEVVNCSAITERGKSTLWRNICLSAAVGREFAPVLKAGPARRILYLDFETRWPRLRPDITKMLVKFDQRERAMVAENLHIIADCRIDGLRLSLSSQKHWGHLSAEVERLRPDIVIVDTLTTAFDIDNENDNSEGARIMKKLCDLAEKFGCVVVFLHHIGKIKQEEGNTAYSVYRSRGGSVYSGNAHVIINLLPDLANKERFTLECPKLKGEYWPDTIFDINRESRWCDSAGAPVAAPSVSDRLLGIFNGQPLKRTAILTLLSGLSEDTVDRQLKTEVDAGNLIKRKDGREVEYLKKASEAATQDNTPHDPQTYRAADSADCPQDEENNPDNIDWGDLPESEFSDLAEYSDDYREED